MQSSLLWQGSYASRTVGDLKPVLFAPQTDIAPSTIAYHMIRGGTEHKNITAWSAGTIGGEFNKAYGHYHVTDFKETYTCLEGRGLMYMQKPGASDTKTPDQIVIVALSPRDSITVPPFWGHAGINIGTTWFVTSDDSPVFASSADEASHPKHADYAAVTATHGFAYYVLAASQVEATASDITFSLHNTSLLLQKNASYSALPKPHIFGTVKEFETYSGRAGWFV